MGRLLTIGTIITLTGLAALLFAPIYLVQSKLDLTSISAYLLGGFIFIEVLLFLLKELRKNVSGLSLPLQ